MVVSHLIEGDLILDKNTILHWSIKVLGKILGKDGMRYNLKVFGDIAANNITANNITARGTSNISLSALLMEALYAQASKDAG